MDASQQELKEELHVRWVARKLINDVEDRMRGKMEQQMEPVFSVTQTDSHCHVTGRV